MTGLASGASRCPTSRGRGAARLVAAMVVGAVLLPSTAHAAKKKLFLEVDYIKECTTAFSPKELDEWFGKSAIDITGDSEGNTLTVDLEVAGLDAPEDEEANASPRGEPQATEGSESGPPDGAATPTSETDPVAGAEAPDTACPTGYIPKEKLVALLEQTRNHEAPTDGWYAHGLLLPHEGYEDEEGQHLYIGMMWLDDFTDTLSTEDITRLRQSFVVFQGNIGDNQPVLARTVAHELAHVLNGHHCEDEASPGFYGNDPATHIADLLAHIATWEADEDHVKPGGDPWCDDAAEAAHRARYHANASDCCKDQYSMGLTASSATLTVTPQQDRYFPGEPIYVDVSVTPGAGAVHQYCLQDQSLTSSSQNLRFTVAGPGQAARIVSKPVLAETFRSVLPPQVLIRLHADRSKQELDALGIHHPMFSMRRALEPVPLGGTPPVPVGVWYGLPRDLVEWDPSDSADKTITIQASLVLYEIAGGSPDDCRTMAETAVAVQANGTASIVLGVAEQARGKFDPAAHQLFTTREARRALWLGRPDRLPPDLVRLAKEAQFDNSIYQLYAQIVAGSSLGNSRLERTRRRRFDWRVPEPKKQWVAHERLRQACKKADALPKIYRDTLRREYDRIRLELGEVQEACGTVP